MSRVKVEKRARAKKLRSQGRSVKEIARLLEVSKSSVSVWVRDVQLGQKQQQRLAARERQGVINSLRTRAAFWRQYHLLHPKLIRGPRWPERTVEKFFDTWTPEMAYVLGYFTADGCMYRNKRGSYYIGFVSTDKELIETTKVLMGAKNRIEEYQSPKPNHKRRYALQVGSHKLFRKLQELGYTPAKSLTLSFPTIPQNMLGHFLRGYFDGDGCVSVGSYFQKGRSKPSKIFMANFTCGSRTFLAGIQASLAKLKIGQGSLCRHGSSAWSLSYSSRATRQLYRFLYPTSTVPCLKRKKEKYEQGMINMGP